MSSRKSLWTLHLKCTIYAKKYQSSYSNVKGVNTLGCRNPQTIELLHVFINNIIWNIKNKNKLYFCFTVNKESCNQIPQTSLKLSIYKERFTFIFISINLWYVHQKTKIIIFSKLNVIKFTSLTTSIYKKKIYFFMTVIHVSSCLLKN